MGLLAVSCGARQLLRCASRLWRMDVWGIDISTAALGLARQKAPDARLVRCNGIDLPFPDNTFHYIANLGSLEHYANVPQGIEEMARILRPDGKVAILLPNSYYLVDIIWQVWRTGYGPSHRQLLEHFATVGEWNDMLAKGGIETLSIHAHNFRFPLSAVDWYCYLKRPRKFLNLLIRPFIPFYLAYSFLFIGRKHHHRE